MRSLRETGFEKPPMASAVWGEESDRAGKLPSVAQATSVHEPRGNRSGAWTLHTTDCAISYRNRHRDVRENLRRSHTGEEWGIPAASPKEAGERSFGAK
jgi:hypothetical protein